MCIRDSLYEPAPEGGAIWAMALLPVLLVWTFIFTPIAGTITAWLIGRCGIYLSNPLPYVSSLMILATGYWGLSAYMLPCPFGIRTGHGELMMPLKAA